MAEKYKTIDKIRSYKELDDAIIPRVFKEYSSVDDYYTKCSSKDDLKNIKVRSIFFNARDDALSPVDIVDFTQCICQVTFFHFSF